TTRFRERLEQGETLDAVLPEAFAVVREAARRAIGLRHFDVQLIGGMVLNDGKIAEMRTGEGKTLVATLPAYLNALTGAGVHVITVNDYLARRDAEWMGQVYRFLGLTTGVIVSQMDPVQRKEAYAADITYGTNNEFGFDYLRDNMAFRAEDRVQRGHAFCVVDEVDSILIDEARTPLIISGPAEESTELYGRINKVIPRLERQVEEDGPGDFSVDEKTRQVMLTEAGHERAEQILVEAGILADGASLYDSANITVMHHLNAALRAHHLFTRDVQYVVRDGEVVIVDEFTGRLMPGRRWSEGLHQAVEAKEGVPVKQENQTLASITFQNYFRLYDKLSGMTGTADTEAYEFQQIYGLEVMVVPTHRTMVRDDLGDLVYLTPEEKYEALIEDVTERHARGQPVLVGTANIDASEHLSKLLKARGIPHEVLNAKYHGREAEIIAGAGAIGAVTIATNMAGRGTDIVLGGNLEARLAAVPEDQRKAARQQWQADHDKVVELGGLHVIGSERHESRRIDNQLRGRSGRQGDPGSSRFYLSLKDDLMRIFASERVAGLMQRLGLEKGEAIEHRWVTRAIENAQRKVEGRNFDLRKHLLEYDDIANEQRLLVYRQRNELMERDDVSDTTANMIEDVFAAVVGEYAPARVMPEEWDLAGLQERLRADFDLPVDLPSWLREREDVDPEALSAELIERARAAREQKLAQVEPEVLRHFEKAVVLQVLDSHWKEHLAQMDHLRQSIGLRAHAQKNPKQEYKREAFEMFKQMLERIKHDVASTLMRVKIRAEEDVEAVEAQRAVPQGVSYQHDAAPSPAPQEEPVPQPVADPGSGPSVRRAATPQTKSAPFVRPGKKVGRNEPCPCGSGKKFKQCHGRLN
ncbi:MAG: preprotein translocase subunit SecA, partial [Pseudomonadota bacterium]|nr:preprotein translocase subunit SecA [Pseudomonadota bacterium]